jgi:serine/threonine-protein kinase
VFVQQGNEIKVLDLGIDRFVEQPELSPGTRVYMAPEQLSGLGVTPRSDIFSLGMVLYEGLTGKTPALDLESPPDLEELIVGVPRHVAQLVQKMIAKQPADRHGSMREVAEALVHGSRRLLEGSGGRGALRPLWRKTSEPVLDTPLPHLALGTSDRTPPPLASSDRSASSRTPALAIAIAVLAGIAISVTVSRLTRRHGVSAPAASRPPAETPLATTSASAPASASPSASAPARARTPRPE